VPQIALLRVPVGLVWRMVWTPFYRVCCGGPQQWWGGPGFVEALAEALARGEQSGAIPPEAFTLLALARQTFSHVGAAWDLAEAERLAALWQERGH
jgi:hypothetical protein